jgi:phosphoribosylanthranilate isomerase
MTPGGDCVFHVKICGVTTAADAEMVATAGGDAIGLNFVPGSPRQLDLARGREVADAIPAGVLRVGVFAGTSAAEIRRIAHELALDAIQLHGHLDGDREPVDPPGLCGELAGLPVRFAQANYCDLPEVLDALSIEAVDAVLLDVGLSSDQLADHDRGFSFDADGPLDLRFDPTEGEPAWRIVNRMKPESLADIIYEFGEERHSRRIARRMRS